jgi:hypothetical protein
MFDKIKQNKIMFFIFGVYLAALAKEVSMLLDYRQQADYLLLDSIDQGNLFIVILGFLILIDGLALWFMLKQHPAGLWLAIFSTTFKRVEEYFVLQISFDNFDLLKDLIIQKRLAQVGQWMKKWFLNLLVQNFLPLHMVVWDFFQ